MVWQALARLVEAHGRAVLAEVVATKGSTPREEGAFMFILPGGAICGTIGGGNLEWRAIAAAQAMLEKGETRRDIRQSLGPDLGQCCGGQVMLALTSHATADLPRIRERAAGESDPRRVLQLFGAGHVGRAIVLALAPLPFRLVWVDDRPEIFPSHIPANVALRDDPLAAMAAAGPGSFALILTHSHTLDLQLADAGLRNGEIAHLGMIGSATKKARFRKRLMEMGWDGEALSRLHCPIGVEGLASKLPAAIAASVATDLLIRDERLRSSATPLPATMKTA